MSEPANIIHINADKVSAPKVTVIGVGGAGSNAVNNMIQADLAGVDFVVANTDAQALEQSLCNKQIQLGPTVTCGLGAGSHPEVGLAAAEKSLDEIKSVIAGSNMLFITAGMGGGTGTGGAPVVARAAREEDILTVGVVTKPFEFEGPHRMQQAEEGITELSQFVDTLIVIPNQNLFRIADENTTFADAFKLADSVLHGGVRSITDMIVLPGLVNIDFADVRAVIAQMGRAVMGTGEAEGDNRAHEAAEAAISNPLLEDDSIAGARNVLINITGGADLLLLEVNEAANRVRAEVNSDANIIFGSAFDERLKGKIRVSVITTGACKERACKSTELKMALKLDNTLVSRNSMMSAADTLQPQTVTPLSRDNSSEDRKRLSQIVTNEADDESKDGDAVNENIEVGSGTGIKEVKAEQRGKLETSSQVASRKTSGEASNKANSVGTRASGLVQAEQEERIKTEFLRFRHEISSSDIKEEYGVVSEKMSFVVVTDTVGAKIYKIPSEKSALLLEAPYANRLKLHDSLGKAKSTAWNFCEQISSELAGNGSKTGIEKSPCLDFLYWSENEVPNLCS